MNREPIKIIGDIVKNFMDLTEEQILIYNQDFILPATSGLFIILQDTTSQAFASNNRFIPATENVVGAEENIISLNKEEIIINVISKNSEARLRRAEIAMALRTNFSQGQQEIYQFKITNITSSLNVSEAEGAGMLNRFATTVSLFTHYEKTINTPYYDNFTNNLLVD